MQEAVREGKGVMKGERRAMREKGGRKKAAFPLEGKPP